MKKIEVTLLPQIPHIQNGDEIGDIICSSLKTSGMSLERGDILAIASKIIAKAEGRVVSLDKFQPTHFAKALAQKTGRDPRIIEAILEESADLLSSAPGTPDKRGTVLVRHNSGLVLTNAGIDRKNLGPDAEDVIALLPKDSDISARKIANEIKNNRGLDVGVVVVDSLGDPYRAGTHGKAIGVANVPARSIRQVTDLEGRAKTADVAFADGIAALAMILMGEGDEGSPVVLFRGLEYVTDPNSSIKDILK